MVSSRLIRLGGLAAATGGILYAGVGLLEGPFMVEHLYYMDNVHGYGFVALSLPLGALAAVAGLHALQRHRYGLLGTSASLAAFMGLALAAGALTIGVAMDRVFVSPLFGPLFGCVFIGLIVAGGGMVILGALTAVGGVLPWWCGVALVAGSPPGLLLMMAVSARASDVLVGAAWVLVGYALFRAAERRHEQPSRVR